MKVSDKRCSGSPEQEIAEEHCPVRPPHCSSSMVMAIVTIQHCCTLPHIANALFMPLSPLSPSSWFLPETSDPCEQPPVQKHLWSRVMASLSSLKCFACYFGLWERFTHKFFFQFVKCQMPHQDLLDCVERQIWLWAGLDKAAADFGNDWG